MKPASSNGFSLIELLVAMAITLTAGAAMFQLFRQGERVFRDELTINEQRQTARLLASQIADDLRIAGQGVPVYASQYLPPTEETVTLLSGSNSTRINFRAGYSDADAHATRRNLNLSAGTATRIELDNASAFSGTLGRTAYLKGWTSGVGWTWIRGTITATTWNAVDLLPVPSTTATHFDVPPSIALEEGIAIYLDRASNAIRRTTATSLVNPLNAAWAPANELGTNVVSLQFTYLDQANRVVVPGSLEDRARVVAIETALEVETATALRNGFRPRTVLTFRSTPPNLQLVR